jgi:uncharacterized protein YjaG (DUF416 family)
MIQEINKLKDLDFQKQAVFAYLTCERLYPNYVFFSENFNFGDPGILRSAVDYLNDNLFTIAAKRSEIDSLLNELNKNTPDTEDFTTHLVSSALDACTTIQDSLEFLIDKKFSRIIQISTNAIDTVDMYIQEIEGLDYNSDKDFQNKINNHPLMKKEIDIQIGIIRFLCKSKTLNFEDIITLLLLQDNNKRGSLNL